MSILSKTCDPERVEKLERVLRYPGVRAKWAGYQVHIYSTEHRAWWRPDGAGYVTDHPGAGVYSFTDALARTRHCGPEKGIQFYRYPWKISPEGPRLLEVFLRVLNEAVAADARALTKLVNQRVECSAKLADHPTIQCGPSPYAYDEKPAFVVGPLGVINGLVEAVTGERIAAVQDEKTGQILCFAHYVQPVPKQNPDTP